MVRCLLTLLLIALCASTAHATPRSPDPDRDPQVRGWLAVAAAHWGASPGCRGGVGTVRAEWSTHPGAWASAWHGGCWIALDPDRYPRPAALDAALWAAGMCSVIAHEWGHLLGRPHSPDPTSLMAPLVPLNTVAGCPTWPPGPVAPPLLDTARARTGTEPRRKHARRRGDHAPRVLKPPRRRR